MAKTKSRISKSSSAAEIREFLMAESAGRIVGRVSEDVDASLDVLGKAKNAFHSIKRGLEAYTGRRFFAAAAEFAAALEGLDCCVLPGREQMVAVVRAYMARSLWFAEPAQEEVRCRAVAVYELALKIWRQSGQWKLLVDHLSVLATMQFVSGKPQEALAFLKQAEEVIHARSASFEISRIAEFFCQYCRHLILSGEWELAQKNLENAMVLTSVSASDEHGYVVDRPAPESFMLYELMALVAEHNARELRRQSLALKAALC